MEHDTDSDYYQEKTIINNFEIKKIGKYHDLYLKGRTLLLAVFESFRKMCFKTYELEDVFQVRD